MNKQDNIINICVDEHRDGEMTGRIYHCYEGKPWDFGDVIQMMKSMEMFFDKLSFPQASTKTRTFVKERHISTDHLKKLTNPQAVMKPRGKVGTFVVTMRYRQNSSWQGDIKWMEQEYERRFVSELEFLKIISNALGLDKKE